jgi:DNA-binding transcriptional ArsR family regulator
MDTSQPLGYAPLMERRPATPEEARALSNPVRLRILRLTLDQALTNKELAERLGRDPGTILHHVRALVATGFLAPEPDRRGARGATERPYRATGKSWTLDVGDRPSAMLAMVDAFREELSEADDRDVRELSRLGVRLRPGALEGFTNRLEGFVADLKAADDPTGEPFSFFVGLHRRSAHPPAARRSGRSSRRRRAGEDGT